MGGAAAELLGQLIVARIHPVNRARVGPPTKPHRRARGPRRPPRSRSGRSAHPPARAPRRSPARPPAGAGRPRARPRRRCARRFRCRRPSASLDLELSGSASRTRCRGRSSGSSARSGSDSSSSGRSSERSTTPRRSSSIVRLVLRGRRHDLGVEDRPFVVELVAVVEDAPRRLGASVTDSRAWLDLDGGRVGLLVLGDQAQAPRRPHRPSRRCAPRCCETGSAPRR